VNARKVNLLAVDRSSNVSDSDNLFHYELPVDSSLQEFTVSVSGHQPLITVTDPEGPLTSKSCWHAVFDHRSYCTSRPVTARVGDRFGT